MTFEMALKMTEVVDAPDPYRATGKHVDLVQGAGVLHELLIGRLRLGR